MSTARSKAAAALVLLALPPPPLLAPERLAATRSRVPPAGRTRLYVRIFLHRKASPASSRHPSPLLSWLTARLRCAFPSKPLLRTERLVGVCDDAAGGASASIQHHQCTSRCFRASGMQGYAEPGTAEHKVWIQAAALPCCCCCCSAATAIEASSAQSSAIMVALCQLAACPARLARACTDCCRSPLRRPPAASIWRATGSGEWLGRRKEQPWSTQMPALGPVVGS